MSRPTAAADSSLAEPTGGAAARPLIPRAVQLLLSTIVGGIAVTLILTVGRPPRGSGVVPTRTKGSTSLHVYRQNGTNSEEMLSGDRFRSGDNIRFSVDLPDDSRVKIIGVQSDGKFYTAWPLAGASKASVVTAGDDELLDGAVRLDSTSGREKLYLIACPPEVASIPCLSDGAGLQPVCPPECDLSEFDMDKTGPM